MHRCRLYCSCLTFYKTLCSFYLPIGYPMTEYLYLRLERELRAQIGNKQLNPGCKLPSIRETCQLYQISKSTVQTAYARLEADGLIEVKFKSGYYVRQSSINSFSDLKTPALSQPDTQPRLITSAQVIVDIMQRGAAFDLLNNSKLDPYNDALRRALSKALRRQNSAEQLYYGQPQGDYSLRVQLAKCIRNGALDVSADDITITHGCQHALLLAILATTKTHDVVAIESPGFYGALQLLEVLDRKVLEIPCSADQGISIDALKLAAQHWDIKALILTPSFATPTGACIPEENKDLLLNLADQCNFCIIEDDIYAELHWQGQRARTLYSYDKTGSVILCSSLSKSLSRDLRIGWIVSKKYQQQILVLKVASAMASSVSQQQGVALFIQQGGLDRHLKLRRKQLKLQHSQLQDLISRYLPMALSASQPNGGMALWLELPKKINTLTLYHQARKQGISIAPGSLFSAQSNYQHYLRLSFAHPWTPEREVAFKALAKLINTQLKMQ